MGNEESVEVRIAKQIQQLQQLKTSLTTDEIADVDALAKITEGTLIQDVGRESFLDFIDHVYP